METGGASAVLRCRFDFHQNHEDLKWVGDQAQIRTMGRGSLPTLFQALVVLLLLRIRWPLNVPSQRMDGSLPGGLQQDLHPLTLCYMSNLKRQTVFFGVMFRRRHHPRCWRTGSRTGPWPSSKELSEEQRRRRSYNPDSAASMMHPAQPRNRSPHPAPPTPPCRISHPRGQGW